MGSLSPQASCRSPKRSLISVTFWIVAIHGRVSSFVTNRLQKVALSKEMGTPASKIRIAGQSRSNQRKRTAI